MTSPVAVKTEFCDKRALETLLRRSDIDDENMRNLEKMYRGIRDNHYTVKYKVSRLATFNYGRIYASCGYQTLKRELRHTLASDHYWDVDMANAHPRILRHLLKEKNMVYEQLDQYVDNRESILAMMGKEGIPRADAKQLVIAIINGKAMETVYADHDFKPQSKALQWIIDWHTACESIREAVLRWDMRIIEDIKKTRGENKRKLLRTVIANVLGNEEDKILKCMEASLQKKGFQIDTYVFDGLMVRKTEKSNLTDEVLVEVQNEILEKTGYDMPIVIKPMGDGYDIEITEQTGFTYLADPDDWEPCEHALSRFNSLYGYNIPSDNPRQLYFRVKKYVEHFIAEVRNPSTYILEDTEGHSFIKKERLIDVIASLPNCSLSPVITEKMPSFVSVWLKDPYRRSYDRIDYCPFNSDVSDCPEHVYNLWKGFSPHIHSPFSEDETDDLLEPYHLLLNVISNYNPDLRQYIENWTAQIVQNPSVKSRTSLVITGRQGSGKGQFVQMIANLIGEVNFYSTGSVDLLFGTHAEGAYRRLLVCGDELHVGASGKYTDAIKRLVTEPKIDVNPKGVQPFNVKCACRFIVTSNYPNPLRIDVKSGDRRFVIMKTSEELFHRYKKNDWDNMAKHLASPKFIACLYHHLMGVDISDFDFEKQRPTTEATDILYESSISSHEHFLCEWILEYESDVYGNHDVTRAELYSRFRSWCQSNGAEDKIPSAMAFRTRLRGMDLPMEDKTIKGQRLYRFKPSEVEESLKKKFGFMFK